MTTIDIRVHDHATIELWTAVGHLVELLPGGWVLIGGLMVQLHALEHGITVARPTRDIDILGQARPPGTLNSIDAKLRADGFEPILLDLDGYAHRYDKDGLTVDVFAPDGIHPPPDLGGGRHAIGVPGGTQALARSEMVTVTVKGLAFELRRPTLLAAVLIKARSLMVHGDPDTQREDLLQLLALIDDPRDAAAGLPRSERKWLRAAEQRLNLSGPSSLDADTVRRAGLAHRLLVRAAGTD